MTESCRRHNRDNFFKYMPAETARKVLLTGRLRWSCPLLFNDPFDVPQEIAPGFTSKDVANATAELLNQYLDQPPEDLNDFDEALAQILTIARRGLPPALREQLRAEIYATLEEIQTEESLQALRSHWKKQIPTLRILCLAESPNHVAMWNHYSDQYKGVVLGLKCNDVTQNAFLVAERIEYLRAKHDLYTDHGLAKLMCLKPLAGARETNRLATLTKSDDWSYEKEWRIVDYADHGDGSQHSDRIFAKEDLSHIYLGPLIADHDVDHILSLARSYPNVRVFHTKIGMDRELHFTPVEG